MGFSLFTDLITPTKYKIPEAPQIDVTTEQKNAVAGNEATFAAAKDLARQYNEFMAQQVQARLKQNMPYMQGLEDQAASNYAKQLRGELSESDAAAVQRRSAARALGSGVNVGALTSRDLGLSQYQIQQQAQAQMPGFLQGMNALKAAPMYDPASMFMSPAQRIGVTQWNKTQQWNVQNLKNQMAVQPEPWAKALAGFGDSILDAAASYFTMGGSAMADQGDKKKSGGGKKKTFTVGDAIQDQNMMGDWGYSGAGGSADSGYWSLFQ